MKTFNITAQIYEQNDKYKQTLLMNQIIESSQIESAIELFKSRMIVDKMILVKILSIEQIDTI